MSLSYTQSYLCFNQNVTGATVFKAQVDPNTVVVHFSTSRVGRDYFNFLSYNFLEGL